MGLKMMSCLGRYVLSELRKPDFMFLATGPESILVVQEELWRPKFF